MASIRVIFMGSVLSIAVRVAAGNVVPPIIGRQPMLVRFKKDLLFSFMVVLLQQRHVLLDHVIDSSGAGSAYQK
jgi:hypothetical protein